jgi:hypothetical protein
MRFFDFYEIDSVASVVGYRIGKKIRFCSLSYETGICFLTKTARAPRTRWTPKREQVAFCAFINYFWIE